ncbi:MAG TPA: TonB-dependent receptor [Opitutaceae bacterium]|jgi:vitamin B12 transporter|nr:TonB-dependent receptor [Opitutaceae bacterium]
MKKKSILARAARRGFLACAFSALGFIQIRADDSSEATPQQLAPFIVTATRTPDAPQTLGTVVDQISAADLARRQLSSLKDALGGIPGAPASATGQSGGITSIFLRGANSNQTLFLVDGIRFSDPNTDYSVFLGGAMMGAGDSLEVAHGPQSTLYGGEAIGGVVSLRAQKGAGAPTGQVSAEAGSFGTVDGSASVQGTQGPWAYNVSAAAGHTHNGRPNNSFNSGNVVLRLDRTLTNNVSVGGTLRGFNSVYGDPGNRFTNAVGDFERENNWLGTLFAELAPCEYYSSRITLGGQDRRLVSVSSTTGKPPAVTVLTNRRAVLDWQNTIVLPASNRLTAGLTAETNTTRNTGFGKIDQRQKLFAVFAEDEWSPVKNVFLTGGLRRDHFDTFGNATTGRATAAWLVVPKTLKLRASYGTGFRSPSFIDLFAKSAFFNGNPNLRPEHARGWDAGMDYYLPENRGTLSATYFQTTFHDLIESTPDFSSEINVDQARTRGVELSAKIALSSATELQLAYTYLEAIDATTHTRLLRRPRNSVSADVWHDFGTGVSGGVGLKEVDHRADINAQTFATVEDPDYTLVRVYAAWQVTKSLTLKARIENALDKRYEEVNGYPALGFGAFAGAEWKF